jgi:hypothetical protein
MSIIIGLLPKCAFYHSFTRDKLFAQQDVNDFCPQINHSSTDDASMDCGDLMRELCRC